MYIANKMLKYFIRYIHKLKNHKNTVYHILISSIYVTIEHIGGYNILYSFFSVIILFLNYSIVNVPPYFFKISFGGANCMYTSFFLYMS